MNVDAGLAHSAPPYEAVLERAFALAESGRFVSLTSLKQQLKREGYAAVETALRGTHDRRELRALCQAAILVRAQDQAPPPRTRDARPLARSL